MALAAIVLAYVVLIPFSTRPLPHAPAFLSGSEGMMAMADLLTAVFLYSQFAIARSRALLVLAGGYAFTAMVVVLRICMFPGVFAPNGLLGAGPQSAAWLYSVWHLGFALAAIGYVLLKDREPDENSIRPLSTLAVAVALLVLVGLVAVVAVGVTAGQRLLPDLIQNGSTLSTAARRVTELNVAAAALALTMLALRQTSVLDRWLVVSLGAMTAELTAVCFFVGARYSVGFYVTALYALMTSIIVLAALHSAVAREYSRIVRSFLDIRRDQEKRMLSLQGATGALAHEIRQPLAAITMEARAAREYMRRTPTQTSEVDESLEAIARYVGRADDVIGSIRKLFDGADQGMTSVDLNSLVTDALCQMQRELEALAITVELSLSTDAPAVQGHRDQLLQVLLNLLRNSADALRTMTSRARVVWVQTRLVGGERLVLTVRDSGPGVDPRIARELFDVFKTTKASGMGLGLALCKVIVEQHGGEIFQSSGDGAQFQIVLPAAPQP